MSSWNVAQWGAFLVTLILIPAMLLTLYRVLRGPRAADRVVAADLFGVLAVGAIGAYAVLDRQPLLLTPALVIALVAFLGTVGFAYYLSQKGGR